MSDFLENLPDLGIKPAAKKPPQIIEIEPANVTVKYVRPKCPKCGNKNVPTYNSNHLPIRYHQCSNCGFCFKSVETEE
jgi:predicted RNA-binding Zn-ribbon protein involved in translation (DUF1610 family)